MNVYNDILAKDGFSWDTRLRGQGRAMDGFINSASAATEACPSVDFHPGNPK